MKNTNKCIAAFLISMFSVACVAQEDDGPSGFSYVTYYVCDVATQDAMDEIVEHYEKPVLDRFVEEGKLIAWGYLSHFTGGRWRKAMYHASPTIEEAVGNQIAIFQEIYQDNPAAGQARAEACAAHDDYIWAQDQGSGPGTDRGEVSMSVYYVCDFKREGRADEIVESTVAPVLNQLVSDGKLMSWGWLSHRIGGKYRRLHTMTGASHEATLGARRELLQTLNESAEETMDEFSDICPAHSDYLWNIVHEAP